MSTGDAFSRRGDALENRFFADLDRKLIEQLQAKSDAESLAKALGIEPGPLATALLKAGVSAQNALSLRLVPLILVAWADGRMEPEESQIVLDAAQKQGIQSNDPAGQLLANWLKTAPPADMISLWSDYAKAIISHLSASEAEQLRSAITSEIKAVANAAGGVLGWAAVSSGECKVMTAVENALAKGN